MVTDDRGKQDTKVSTSPLKTTPPITITTMPNKQLKTNPFSQARWDPTSIVLAQNSNFWRRTTLLFTTKPTKTKQNTDNKRCPILLSNIMQYLKKEQWLIQKDGFLRDHHPWYCNPIVPTIVTLTTIAALGIDHDVRPFPRNGNTNNNKQQTHTWP